MQPSNGSNKPWISGRGPLQRRDYRMDNHARERGSLDLLCNQRNNDLHRHSSKGTTDNDAHITDPTRHRNSRCTGSLLNGIRTRLHPAPRRQLPNPSSSTDPLEKRAGDGSPSKNPSFLDSPVISTRLQVKVRLCRGKEVGNLVNKEIRTKSLSYSPTLGAASTQRRELLQAAGTRAVYALPWRREILPTAVSSARSSTRSLYLLVRH